VLQPCGCGWDRCQARSNGLGLGRSLRRRNVCKRVWVAWVVGGNDGILLEQSKRVGFCGVREVFWLWWGIRRRGLLGFDNFFFCRLSIFILIADVDRYCRCWQ